MLKMVKIEINNELFEKIKKRMKKTQFNSVDSYITYILEQVLLNIKKEEDKTEKVMSKEDEEIVKKRLKALGYPDEGV